MALVEKRYAQALFELSENDLYNTSQEFQQLVDIYKSDADFRQFLTDPRIKSAAKTTLIRNVFSNVLSRNMLNFLLLLLDKRRISNIPQIFEQFVHLADQKANMLVMKIITAQALEEDQLNIIKENFRKKYNASAVKAEAIIDPSIVGGVKVIIGDKVYDGSIKGRIESLTGLVGV